MKNIEAGDIWITKKIYDDAETTYYEGLSKVNLILIVLIIFH